MSKRRSFLKNASIFGAGLLIAPSLATQSFARGAKKKQKIGVIGAGFAGLAAAYKLQQLGFDVLVLESSQRIGGRVYSHPLANKQVVELGAEWIGASHERVIALCKEFDLTLDNNQFDTHLIYKGKYYNNTEWDYSESWNRALEKLKEAYPNLSQKEQEALDKMDWWRLLVNSGCEDKDLDLMELIDSTDFGESIRHVSAYTGLAQKAGSSPKNEMDYKIVGGNIRLAEQLMSAVGQDKIRLNHSVRSIEQHKKVKVSCTNGEVFEFDKIVCALPTYALSKIAWSPALPASKVAAINELQYARINKHVVTFEERFWKDEAFDMVTDECPHYFYHATKNQAGPSGALISYTIGDKAAIFANRSKAAAATDINNTLAPHFGDIAAKIADQTNFYWGDNASSKGAYALYGKDQWFRIKPVLAQNFKNVHFAGEHLADWQGFMEGAIVTGEDAALAICKNCK